MSEQAAASHTATGDDDQPQFAVSHRGPSQSLSRLGKCIVVSVGRRNAVADLEMDESQTAALLAQRFAQLDAPSSSTRDEHAGEATSGTCIFTS